MIEDIHNKQGFENSVRFFHTFDGALSGATDIDLCYERHGHILFIEGKKAKTGIIAIKKGQWIALNALSKKQDVKVYLVGECVDMLGISIYYVRDITLMQVIEDLFDTKNYLINMSTYTSALSLQELKDYIKDIVKDW